MARDLDEDALAAADLFHFGYPPMMASTYAYEGAGPRRLANQILVGDTDHTEYKGVTEGNFLQKVVATRCAAMARIHVGPE